MQTRFPAPLMETTDGKLAEQILRSCVHCGFCTATCPTFLKTGNELDSPRGRIFLIKEMLEKGSASDITARHLDRCLTCRSCETTCPSNVQYHTLVDIGRLQVRQYTGRTGWQAFHQSLLLAFLGSKTLFSLSVATGKLFRALLPRSLSRQLPGKPRFTRVKSNPGTASRKVVLLDGCVQSSLSPDTNQAAQVVLKHLDINTITIRQESCCGAMHYHTQAQDAGISRARQLVEQLESALKEGAEAIISTASGCGSFIKDYPVLFRNDPVFLERATNLVVHVKDISEFLTGENLEKIKINPGRALAFHSPCSLQHGQHLNGKTETLLAQLGFDIPPVQNAHLCCGSAGTYSLFHSAMADSLRKDKLESLKKVGGEGIATANIGCQCHLAAKADVPVRHWLEFLAESLEERL